VKDTVSKFLIHSWNLTRKKLKILSVLMLPIALTLILRKTGVFPSPKHPEGCSPYFFESNGRETKAPLPEGLASLRPGIHSRSPQKIRILFQEAHHRDPISPFAFFPGLKMIYLGMFP
jgi:hypothetical protein